MYDTSGPSVDDCNDFIDWIEHNNSIDLNHVRFRIREVDAGDRLFVITCEWRFRDKLDRPQAHELMIKRDWVIDPWYWDGAVWTASIWRNS